MVYSPEEYVQIYKFNNKYISAKSLIRRIEKGLLPSKHTAHKKGRQYVIEVPTDFKVIVKK